jgi:hypothetical protein
MASAAVLAAALAIGALTLLPHPRQAGFADLTPWTCLVCGELGGVDVVLNLLLFLPLGAALHRAGLRPLHAAGAGALFSLAIELLQAFVVPGRDASISDFVTNTIGAALGAQLSQAWPLLARPSPRAAAWLAGGALAAWAAVLGFSALAFRPAPLPPPLHVEWSPARPPLEQFKGELLAATTAGEPLADGSPPPDRLIGDIARRDVTIAARIVAGPRSDGLTPILDVTDEAGRPTIGISRDGDDLIFSIRTIANSLRLRGGTVRLVRAFPDAAGAQLSVAAGLQESRLWVEVTGERAMRAETGLGADQGWRLVAPFTGWAGPKLAALLTAIWVAGPLVPILYWLGRSRAGLAGAPGR